MRYITNMIAFNLMKHTELVIRLIDLILPNLTELEIQFYVYDYVEHLALVIHRVTNELGIHFCRNIPDILYRYDSF